MSYLLSPLAFGACIFRLDAGNLLVLAQPRLCHPATSEDVPGQKQVRHGVQRFSYRSRLLMARLAAIASHSWSPLELSPTKQRAPAPIESQLHILAPEQDETIMDEAGFSDVSMLYVEIAFRGWVAYV